jgi:hypothetical protein
MIDQIAIRKGSGFNLLSPHEWQAIELEERADLIRAGRVEFLDDGESVPLREALLRLKAMAGQLSLV